MTLPRGAARAAGAVVVVVLAVLWFLVGPGSGRSDDATSPGSTGSAGVRSSSSATASASRDPDSGLAWVDAEDLPAEARATLGLIAAGGPFPYARDGVTFGNREGLLPRERSGYYREFTVRTPGESDRGARRIVAGDEGERYWTADHYESFSRVRGGAS
ncbi:hypothetical protein GCM10011519_09580 [Marmoricola endophyticus]|uniref:Uncharacterized protein n=1 Tax=Marmoricola endophyticus TaxID=2040280 RepID=A0A917BDE7_9ACTN|nr:ribonuclease domain-containing protein [Marmoricola endophyticus]GGF38086.1 hypothetical protein GCM10011519_09580 [Marmoricola endophyticus]